MNTALVQRIDLDLQDPGRFGRRKKPKSDAKARFQPVDFFARTQASG
jgi:hypothetical protein